MWLFLGTVLSTWDTAPFADGAVLRGVWVIGLFHPLLCSFCGFTALFSKRHSPFAITFCMFVPRNFQLLTDNVSYSLGNAGKKNPTRYFCSELTCKEWMTHFKGQSARLFWTHYQARKQKLSWKWMHLWNIVQKGGRLERHLSTQATSTEAWRQRRAWGYKCWCRYGWHPNNGWRSMSSQCQHFAWLPEDVVDAFCSLALHQDATRPYGFFHEVQRFNEHYQALLHIEGLYYLGETRS